MKIGVIVGGTGAQGGAVVKHLSSIGGYHLKVLTRNTASSHAQALSTLPGVELIQTMPTGHDDESFLEAAKGADFAFINTDGLSIGQVAETYWGIHFYELARRAGVGHFIYSSLDNLQELTDYQEEFAVGHFSGKSRVVDFLRSKPNSVASGTTFWSAIVSGPYIELLSETLVPTVTEDGKYVFALPLGEGAAPFIHLEDFAKYVEWMIRHPSEVSGTELKVATAHVSGQDIATAFTATTGKPSTYFNIPTETWVQLAFKEESRGATKPIGLPVYSQGMTADVERFFFPLTFGENFTKFWNVWQHSGGNHGIVRRDYAKLDQILPERVKSVEEWMKKVGYSGEKKQVLKLVSDRVNRVNNGEAAQKKDSAWG